MVKNRKIYKERAILVLKMDWLDEIKHSSMNELYSSETKRYTALHALRLLDNVTVMEEGHYRSEVEEELKSLSLLGLVKRGRAWDGFSSEKTGYHFTEKGRAWYDSEVSQVHSVLKMFPDLRAPNDGGGLGRVLKRREKELGCSGYTPIGFLAARHILIDGTHDNRNITIWEKKKIFS